MPTGFQNQQATHEDAKGAIEIMRVVKPAGFTIVELLVVIVVIGILATITVSAYSGVQQGARDARRKSDIANITKALQIHNLENGNYIAAGSGCGSGGGGAGWFNLDYDGATTTLKSIAQCLVDSGIVPSIIVDPSGRVNCSASTSCTAYMKSTCSLGTFMLANLESMPSGQDGPANATCNTDWDTVYGMNYVVKVH